MGRIDEKIYIMIFKVLLIFALCALNSILSAQELDLDGPAILKSFRFPYYDAKTGKAKFILYGNEAKALGVDILIEGAVIDVLNRNIKDISEVKNLSKVELYDSTAPSSDVEKFWKDKPYSSMIIKTPSAKYDRSSSIINGDKEIHLRSLFIDLDGVGFEADHIKQTFHVKKDVKVVFRRCLHEKYQKEKKDKEEKEKGGEKELEKKKNDLAKDKKN